MFFHNLCSIAIGVHYYVIKMAHVEVCKYLKKLSSYLFNNNKNKKENMVKQGGFTYQSGL